MQAKFRKIRKGDSVFEYRRFSNCCLYKELLFSKFCLDKELLFSKFRLVKEFLFSKFRLDKELLFSKLRLDKELLFSKFRLDKELLFSKFRLDKKLLFSKFRLDKGGQRDQIEDEVCEGEGGREGEVDGYVGPGFEHLVQLDAGVAVPLHKVVCTVQVPEHNEQ